MLPIVMPGDVPTLKKLFEGRGNPASFDFRVLQQKRPAKTFSPAEC